jgi:hypothetical protein
VNEVPIVAAAEEPQQAAPAPTLVLGLGRRLQYWLPVFALMLLFGEIAFLGLRPAQAESRRLDAAEPAVEERLARAREARATLDLQLRARADPVYQERLRRLRLYPADGR